MIPLLHRSQEEDKGRMSLSGKKDESASLTAQSGLHCPLPSSLTLPAPRHTLGGAYSQHCVNKNTLDLFSERKSKPISYFSLFLVRYFSPMARECHERIVSQLLNESKCPTSESLEALLTCDQDIVKMIS